MARLVLILGGLYGLYSIWVAWQTDSAWPEKDRIHRNQRPVLYWSLMAVAALMVGSFFYFAAFGDY